jgi:rare lipoprotein A
MITLNAAQCPTGSGGGLLRPRENGPAMICSMKTLFFPARPTWRKTSIKQRKTVAGVSLFCMSLVIALGFRTTAAVGEGTVPLASSAMTRSPLTDADDAGATSAKVKLVIDRTGHKRYGKASFYASNFGGRKMANGQRFSLAGNNAASRTLPLGTTARVTNLKTGKSAVVVILDRGPYVDGRIVDLSPATAQRIGISNEQGIAPVEVAPIAVPLPDGKVKLGAAASDPQVADNFLKPERRPSADTSTGG